jgi:3-hydroxyacyl-CoA dehydrogenase/enoyl-CoA hydratase/3-hydroxybutyryl-CoA epimerase
MPMGPFELLDEIGLDIAAHVLESLAGENRAAIPNVSAALARARHESWLGRKTGKGFYVHANGKRRGGGVAKVNHELIRSLATDSTAAAVDAESIQWRLVLPMVNEAAQVLEDGVTDSTDTIDLAIVLGTGFAPCRGGVVQFANTVGIGEIVRRLEELAAQCGPRFAPARLLREAAEAHHDFRPQAPRETVVTRASPAMPALAPSPGTPGKGW